MFRILSLGGGAMAVLLIIVAFIGRFKDTPRLDIMGHTVEAGTLLTLANTCFLIAIFCHLHGGKKGG